MTCQYSEGASDHWAMLEHGVGLNQYSPYVLRLEPKQKAVIEVVI